ncbi:MAG TPA: hypothetical protein VLA89_11835 [Gemmatimonadales bacterium]|nr:hypothetical protein [Gemmatimonadales bacterium]
MTVLKTRAAPGDTPLDVQFDNPLPVKMSGMPLFSGVPLSADLSWRFAVQGKIFYCSDADFDDKVTGQTSADATTPTFLLRNPVTSKRICVPLLVNFAQTGTVAGGAIDIIGVLDRTDRYASGGTSEAVVNANTLRAGGNFCSLYSGATASAATAGAHVRVDGVTVGQDVSPAEGAVQIYTWTPQSGIDLLYPGSSMLWYTYAGTTGPTWFWTFKWLELTEKDLELI